MTDGADTMAPSSSARSEPALPQAAQPAGDAPTRCEQQYGAVACCLGSSDALACVHFGRLTATPAEAVAFTRCLVPTSRTTIEGAADHAPECWHYLPSRAYDEARTLCAVGSKIWCNEIEALRSDRAREPTVVIASLIAAACIFVVLRRTKHIWLQLLDKRVRDNTGAPAATDKPGALAAVAEPEAVKSFHTRVLELLAQHRDAGLLTAEQFERQEQALLRATTAIEIECAEVQAVKLATKLKHLAEGDITLQKVRLLSSRTRLQIKIANRAVYLLYSYLIGIKIKKIRVADLELRRPTRKQLEPVLRRISETKLDLP